MADIALQLEDALIERLHKLAQARGCSVEALIAQWLRERLPAKAGAPDPTEGTAPPWNQEESAFLHEMARALDEVPASTPLAAADVTEWDKSET
ncbi:MAG TPA: hypothetical protein VFP88_07925 [Rhodanobacteraceae bacterium]|nr:hypothetical protein [Rhodanobacteraceae bacterium]